ncbi:hypothetical protein AGMMS49546_21560 [Spirochaetia bacterium]|nr:hypothetical protein AGMMS49546_21560 [Spirochaetia bacterium]
MRYRSFLFVMPLNFRLAYVLEGSLSHIWGFVKVLFKDRKVTNKVKIMKNKVNKREY